MSTITQSHDARAGAFKLDAWPPSPRWVTLSYTRPDGRAIELDVKFDAEELDDLIFAATRLRDKIAATEAEWRRSQSR